MNCAYDKEKLTGYYDGELSAAEKAEVERHIASCSECLRDLGELKSAALLVKELPRLRAPASIAAGVSREIQAAGKLHVLAKFRRTVLWASAAAAGLFIVMNVMYFGSQRRAEPAAAGPAPVAPLARVESLERAAAKSAPADAAVNEAASRRLQEEPLHQAAGGRELADRKAPAAAEEQKPAAPAVDALKKNDAPAAEAREKMAAAPKPVAPPAPTTVAPGAAKPAAAPAPVPAKGESAKALLVEKDKDVARKAEAEAGAAPEPVAKAKAGALGAPAELPPIQCTLSATQPAKVRARMEETLRKMGIPLTSPSAPTARQPRRDAETVFTIEISDSQLAALREELEKPGDARLLQSHPVDPVLPQFRSGGVFGGKKETASPGAAAAGKAKPDAKAESKARDEDGQAAPEAAEPRRKVTLRLVEVKTLPAEAAERALKK